MTNEQKLLILLQKAVENGYVGERNLLIETRDFKNNFSFKLKGEINETNLVIESSDAYNDCFWDSINDLVLNYRNGEIDFVEALFTALINEGLETSGSYVSQFKLSFISLPTSRRLDYLFQTFNELLK